MDSSESQLPLPAVTSFEDQGDAVESENDIKSEDLQVQDGSTTEKSELNDKHSAPKTEQELLFCKYCEFQATDLHYYVNHVNRPSHIKKAAEAYNIRLTKDVPPRLYDCQDCLISCNGENAWNQHLLGQRHRKVLEKKSFQLAGQKQHLQPQANAGGPIKSNQFGNNHYKKPYEKIQRTVRQPNNIPTEALGAKDFATYEEPLIGLEHVTEIQVNGQSPRYHCSLCDAKFDHNLKFPHLVGAKHRMNVLKLKRPQVLHECRHLTQKRSDLTAMLLRESVKLEKEEGRQQIKTKVEKSPFATFQNTSQSSPVRGRGSMTGGARGTRGIRGGRGATRGDIGYQGTSSRGTRGTPRGRGQSYLNTYGSDYGRPSFGEHSYGQKSFGYTGPSNVPYNESFDTYMSSQPSYERPIAQGPLHSNSTERGFLESSYPTAAYSRYSGPPCDDYYPPPPSNYPMPAKSIYATPIQGTYSRPKQDDSYLKPADAETSKPEAGHKPDFSSGLATALGDLTKLVQNEDDASVALHVSNALTQALLQYRIVNVNEGGNPA